MKILILLITALLLSVGKPLAQQTALAGRIYELNSRTRTGTLRYVAGATVQAEFAKPQTSDPLGRFGLLFVGKGIGEAVKVSVEKQGYEVANSRELEAVALPRLDTLPVYVADPAYLAQEQAALLDIQTKVLTRELDALIAKLRSDSATSRRTLAELKERFQQDFQHYGEAEEFLYKRLESVKERLPERAAELARVNLDFASAQYRAAYELYRAGDMEAVIRLIDEDSLVLAAESALHKLDQAERSGAQYATAREIAVEGARRVIDCFKLRVDALLLEYQFYKASLVQSRVLKLLSKINDGQLDLELAKEYSKAAQINRNGGRYFLALEYIERVVEIRENYLGPEHSDLAQTYNDLALVQQYLGEFQMALLTQEKAVAIGQKIPQSENFELGTYYSNLAMIHLAIGNYFKALEAEEKALTFKQSAVNLEQNSLAVSYNNLAVIHRAMGNLNNAIETQKLAINLRQAASSPNVLGLATSHSNLSVIYLDMGDYTNALSSQEKAIAFRTKILPEDHPDLAVSYHTLAEIYNHMGDYNNAIENQRKAINIFEKALPSNHPYLSKSNNNLSIFLSNIGDFQEAIATQERSIDIQKRKNPINHPSIATSYNTLSTIYHLMKDFPRAIENQEVSIKIRLKVLPPDHPDLATSYHNISSTYLAMGDHLKAYEFQKKAIAIRQISLSPTHPDIASSYNQVGNLLFDIGSIDSAIIFKEMALSIYLNRLPSSHATLRNLNSDLVLMYKLKGDKQLAQNDSSGAKIAYRLATKYTPGTALRYLILSYCYYKIGEYEASISASNQAYELDHSLKVQQINNTALAYAKWGKTNEAHSRLTELQALLPNEPLPYRSWSLFHVLQRDFPAALQSLEKAIDLGFNDRQWLDNEPTFDTLRNDPRYIALLKRMQP